MRRFCKRGLPVGLLVVITFLYPLLAPPAHRIDEAHYQQITVGMTLEEVESMFGAPAGSYDWAVPENPSLWLWSVAFTGTPITDASSKPIASGETISEVILNRAGKDATVWDVTTGQGAKLHAYVRIDSAHLPLDQLAHWTSRHGTCTIQFDRAGRVIGKMGWSETRLEPPWHNWRKWFSK